MSAPALLRTPSLLADCSSSLSTTQGNHKSCDHNVIVHPGIASRASGGRRCQTDDNKKFSDQYHHDNHCFSYDGMFYSMSGFKQCSKSGISPMVFETWNNRLYTVGKGPAFATQFSGDPCKSFAAWQAAGQDGGSSATMIATPADELAQIMALAKGVLGM